MSNNYPALSVVIPNHNYAKWIDKAIDSVVSSSYPNKRLAIVDDGSTDDSWQKICTRLGIKNGRANAVHTGTIDGVPAFAFQYRKAGGPSKARNTAIKMVWPDTELFGFLDADDAYLPGKIELSIQEYMKDPSHIGGVYTDYLTLNEQTGLVRYEYKEPFARERLMRECIIHSASIVSKRALEIAGLYDEDLRTCEDYDLWMRISESFCFIHIPQALMLVRVGDHNSTATVKSEVWQENRQRVFEKAQRRLMQNGR